MKGKTKLALKELERELGLLTKRETENTLGGNGPGPEILIDSHGRTYYIDNIGRTNYLMDTNLLFEAIVDSGKSLATWIGAGYDAIKGKLGLGTGAGIAYNALENVYNEWFNNYFATGDYVRAQPGYNPWWVHRSGYSSSGSSGYPGEGLPPY